MRTDVRRCPEKRAHYAHEWYNPLRIQCPGGPDETSVGACWHDSGHDGPTGRFRCELLAGHAGAHQDDRGTWGGKAIWPNETEEDA